MDKEDFEENVIEYGVKVKKEGHKETSLRTREEAETNTGKIKKPQSTAKQTLGWKGVVAHQP